MTTNNQTLEQVIGRLHAMRSELADMEIWAGQNGINLTTPFAERPGSGFKEHPLDRAFYGLGDVVRLLEHVKECRNQIENSK